MKYLVVIIFLLTSCTQFSSQTELMDNISEPRDLDNVWVDDNKMQFFEVNMECMDLWGAPKVLFPWVIFQACALVPDDNWLKETNETPWCIILYHDESHLKHELNHCMGYKD